MRRINICTAAVGAAALLVAVPAAAVVKIATLTGSLYSSQDFTNVFGGGSQLAGYAYRFVITYDTTRGMRSIGPGYDQIGGGSDNFLSNPITYIAITVNGTTKSFQPNRSSSIFTGPDTINFAAGFEQLGSGVNMNKSINIFTGAGLAPALLTSDFGPVPRNWAGVINFFDETANSGVILYLNGSPGTYAVTNAVPEPASWTLLISGFGMVGATLRRRRIATA